MSNKTLITYITNWDRVYENVLEKEKILVKNNIDYFIANSSSITHDSWINLGNNAWCYRQLFEIFKHSYYQDYLYTSILFGDIYTPDKVPISDYIFETEKYIKELPDCYVYSTSFTHDGWSYPATILKDYDEAVSYVCGTDTLYLTVHKDVVEWMFKFLEYFDKIYGIDNYFSGWAVDVLCSAFSIYNKKNVFRNKSSVLVHYENSGYDVGKAHQEMNQIISEGINFMVSNYWYNYSRLNKIVEMMFARRMSPIYSYESFYE